MKHKRNLSLIFVISALIIFAASCSEKKFKIKGEIYGAEDQSIILEKSDYSGRWLPVDSTRIGHNGDFSFKFPSPAAPEIYRLSLDRKYIYIPIDSTETINVSSSLAGFGTDFTLSGSRNAELAEQFDKEVNSFSSINSDSIESFKRGIYSKYMKDSQGSIISYYILTKTVNGKPIFDVAKDSDAKYFAAVATGYKSLRPDDPHTAILEQTSLNALKRKNNNQGNFLEMPADEITMIDIELPDETGENVALSSITGKGKPVVVIFSLLTHPDSPALNIELAKIYNRLNGKVEFYNVALDPDQYSWRDAARNIPWITVYAPGEFNASAAVHYNVYSLPTFFLINSQGELISRHETIQDLDKSLN